MKENHCGMRNYHHYSPKSFGTNTFQQLQLMDIMHQFGGFIISIGAGLTCLSTDKSRSVSSSLSEGLGKSEH